MANDVAHNHECPACRRAEPCASPECRALPRRLCQRCMERAWLHSRKNGRHAPPRVARMKAA
jgi:hypothetical protein